MGTLTAQYVINKAVIQLLDITSVRWSRAELLSWLNDAQRMIVLVAPNSSNSTVVVNLVAGTRQAIPADGWLLLDVYRNMGATGATPGRAIRIVSKELLDGFNPDWHDDTAATAVKNYVYDIQDQTTFWVYPPSDGTGKIQLNYAKVPVDLANELAVIALSDILQTAILDYILYRACSKDAEYAPGIALAKEYWQSFASAVGIKSKAETDNSPNLSLTPKRDMTNPGAQS